MAPADAGKLFEMYLTEASSPAFIGAITGVSEDLSEGIISLDEKEYPTLGSGVFETAPLMPGSRKIGEPAVSLRKGEGIKRAAANATAHTGANAPAANLPPAARGLRTSLRIILDFKSSSNCAHSSAVGRSHFLRLRRSSRVGFRSGMVSLYNLSRGIGVAVWRSGAWFSPWRAWRP